MKPGLRHGFAPGKHQWVDATLFPPYQQQWSSLSLFSLDTKVCVAIERALTLELDLGSNLSLVICCLCVEVTLDKSLIQRSLGFLITKMGTITPLPQSLDLRVK